MEAKTYLPIGSVVLLEEQKKRVMIIGRRVISKSDEKEYDYQGCLYPEGIVSSDEVLLFNSEDIRMCYFIGFQDIEEIAFREMVLNDK